MLPIDEIGEGVLDRRAAEFGSAATVSAAYLAALVRAIERSQMAEAREARDVVSERLSEADTYAVRAAASLSRTARSQLRLAEALEVHGDFQQAVRKQFRGPRGQALLETPFWDKLGPKIRQLFREAQVDPKALATEWNSGWVENPALACATTLREAFTRSQVLAGELHEWGPTPEASPIPPWERFE